MLLQPEEHADVAVVRFRGPLVQGVGLFGQNVSRNMEISFGTAIGVAPGQKPCTRFWGGGLRLGIRPVRCPGRAQSRPFFVDASTRCRSLRRMLMP